MNEAGLNPKKSRAQLEEWKASVAKLRSKASRSSADAQHEANGWIAALGTRLGKGKKKLGKITGARNGALKPIKVGMESAWQTMKSAFSDAATRFNR